MAAKIRLKKVGRRGQPSYRVVVLDGRKPRDAKVVADLGHYDPKTNPSTLEIDGDAALKWLLDGAKATKAARDLLSISGVMAAWDAAKRGETIEIEAKELKPSTKAKKAAAETAESEPESVEAEEASADVAGEADEETSAPETAGKEESEPVAEDVAVEETEGEETEDEENEADEEKASS